MANPQPEQFTRISNELYTAIMQTNFSKRQRKILDLVIRMSYGCGKKHATLRPLDFELVGIHKTDIRQELAHLQQAGVLFIEGDQISLNKDYERWRVGLARSFSNERWNEVLNRNLEDARVGKTPLARPNEVGEIPTVNEPGANPYKACEAPKEKGKENLKEKGITPQSPHTGKTDGQATIEDILARFPRYTSRQTDLIRDYWRMIGQTRRNRTISPSIVLKQMTYWERYPAGIVSEAIEIHRRRYPHKQEDYTAGIMRRLSKEKGGSADGTLGQRHQTATLDRSKFLWKGAEKP